MVQETQISSEEEQIAARNKSAQQQLKMLEEMRKQHKLQSYLAQVNSNDSNLSEKSSNDDDLKFSRKSINTAIYKNSITREETASIVAAVQKKQQYRHNLKQNATEQNVPSSLSMEEETERLHQQIQKLSLMPTKSEEAPKQQTRTREALEEAKAYDANARMELGIKHSYEISNDKKDVKLWKEAQAKQDLVKYDRSRSESYSDSVSDNDRGSTSDHGSESAEDYSDDEDEGEEGYRIGGYHRVTIGETFNQR